MPPNGSDARAPWTAAELMQAPPEVVRRRTSSASGLILGEHIQRQRPLARVDVFDRLIERVVGLDRQDRPEDLLLHQRDVIGRVDHERDRQLPRGQVGVGGRFQRPHVAAVRTRILEQTLDALVVAGRDDRRATIDSQ